MYEVKSDDLVPDFQYANQLIEKFEWISLVHIPQKENQMANALANLAISLTLLKDETVHVPLYHKWVLPQLLILQQEEVNVISVFTIDSEDWRQPLVDYLEHEKLPDELRHRNTTSSFTLYLLQRNTFSALIQWSTYLMHMMRKNKSSNWRSSFWNLWDSPIRAKTSFSNQNDGIILANYG